MTSESCKFVVSYILKELNIPVVDVKLGEVIIDGHLTEEEKNKLNVKIGVVGLEIVEKNNRKLVEKIKVAILEYALHTEEKPAVKLSSFLQKKLNHSYGYLTNTFSATESITIQHYLARVRVERVKGLILIEEYSLSQIAYKLHYSSVSHLSKQFKKITGLSPSQFKSQMKKN